MNATNKIRRVEVRHTNEPSCLSQQALISVPGGGKLAEPICDQVFDRGHVQMATSGSDNFDLGRIRQTIELRSRYRIWQTMPRYATYRPDTARLDAREQW